MNVVRKRALFTIYSLAALAANVTILRDLIDLSRNSATASHHILIPFITIALIYQGRDAIFASVRPDRLGALVAILGGVGFALAARLLGHDGTLLSLAVSGLVLLWIGGFLLFWGRDAFRRALFPLLFLGFMIPMPNALIEGTTRILKEGSAEVVAGLFTLSRTPYHRAGFVFSLPRFVIEIADECSGIHSSIALLLTGLLAGDQFLHSPWRKAVLVLAVLPFAIVKNGIRIVSLSLLATYINPGFLTGQLHHEGGIVFFLLTLAMMAPLLVFLKNSKTTMFPEDNR